MLVVMTGVAVSFISCDDESSDDDTVVGNGHLKGYFYRSGNGNIMSTIAYILYFDGSGKGIRYHVSKRYDEIVVGTYSGVNYYSNNSQMESFVYDLVENTVTIIGIKGHTETLHISNGSIDGYIPCNQLDESRPFKALMSFEGNTYYNGSGKDSNNATIEFIDDHKCKIHAFGYNLGSTGSGTVKDYWEWTEEREYSVDEKNVTLTIYNCPYFAGGKTVVCKIWDYGFDLGNAAFKNAAYHFTLN